MVMMCRSLGNAARGMLAASPDVCKRLLVTVRRFYKVGGRRKKKATSAANP